MKLDSSSYKSKRVFLGIDVHKKKSVIVAICEGSIVKKWSTTGRCEALAEQIKAFFIGAEVFSAYEAGFSGYRLHRILLQSGIRNIVVNPSSIATEINNRVKTDKRDAKKIAEQLAAGLLKGIYVPSEEEEDKRSLTRGREQVVIRRQRIGNQIKMKLLYLGIEMPEKRMSECFLKWVETLELTSGHKFLLEELIGAWREETLRLKRFEKALAKQSLEDEVESIYRSAPGVGFVSARVLSNEFGDMSRFKNERQLSSCTGLTPSEYSSGEKVRKGRITRQGSPHIRGILIEIAWRAIKKDRGLREVYERIKMRREGKRAIVAVARKLLLRLRKCLIDRVPWQDLQAA